MSESKTPIKPDAGTADIKSETKAETKGDTGNVMTDGDAKFLIECLKHTKGAVTIDLDAVAGALDYANPKSVGNRLGALKKRYNLTLTTSAATNKAQSGEVGSGPISPDKVKKPRTPRKPAGEGTPRKRAPAKKRAKKGETAGEDDDAFKANDVKEKDATDEEMKDDDTKGDDTKDDTEDADQGTTSENAAPKPPEAGSLAEAQQGELKLLIACMRNTKPAILQAFDFVKVAEEMGHRKAKHSRDQLTRLKRKLEDQQDAPERNGDDDGGARPQAKRVRTSNVVSTEQETKQQKADADGGMGSIKVKENDGSEVERQSGHDSELEGGD
ncbi:MAG: hypothetical protein M1826_006297 [Phylliscum demangeonii]|nr:MAG: hypothetical protein M1826_006297 [Phylliscum demangeonii]